jgi:monothiol glutaredoxin
MTLPAAAASADALRSQLEQEIQQEIAAHKILIYTKGTKEIPRCGFTIETCQFFDRYNHPYHTVDVLENMEKRQVLSEMTNWPTLPKVFINGTFYGDTDVLEEMATNGELDTIFQAAFANA